MSEEKISEQEVSVEEVNSAVDQYNALTDFDTEVIPVNPNLALKTIEHAKAKTVMMSPTVLRVLPNFNPRIRDAAHQAHVRAIANSIKTEGFYEHRPLAAITLSENKAINIYVTDGHCRLEAVLLAIEEGALIDAVPVVIKERQTTIEDLTVAFVHSNDGKKLTTLEMSIVVKRLTNYGLSRQTIAERLNLSVERVGQLLTIAGAPLSIRQMIETGQITPAMSLVAIQNHGPEAAKVLDEVVKKSEKTGKKASTAQLPERVLKRKLAKAAPVMADLVRKIRANEIFDSLPMELQSDIKKLLDAIKVEGFEHLYDTDDQQDGDSNDAVQAVPGQTKGSSTAVPSKGKVTTDPAEADDADADADIDEAPDDIQSHLDNDSVDDDYSDMLDQVDTDD